MIKTNFHFHTSDDPRDRISYSPYKAIDHAGNLGFNALAFTCHQKFTYTKKYADYAEKKGIILVSGIEAKIEGKHVVILNCDKSAEMLKTFKELGKYKKENPHIFIIAPHPFVLYPTRPSLGKKLEKNIKLFDAIELSIFSNKIFNFNKKAEKIAKKYNKPFIATSDTHYLSILDKNYAVINTEEKNPTAIFEAIKQQKFENKTKTMGVFAMTIHLSRACLRKLSILFPSRKSQQNHPPVQNQKAN